MAILLTSIHFIICGLLLFPFVAVVAAWLRRCGGSRQQPLASTAGEVRFACIITAYKQLDIAYPLIESLVRQSYPPSAIVCVADACPPLADARHQLPYAQHPLVQYCQPAAPLNSKVASLQYALQQLTTPADYVVVFDPDNLATPDLLAQFEGYVRAGYAAIQGRRTAKNLNTMYACADALGEIYKNYIEREVPYRLGSSATIAGSGMAIGWQLFEQFLHSPSVQRSLAQGSVIAAEDKLLQNKIVQSGTVIAYCNTAIVYDEKVSTAHQVTRQRTRWLYAYFENIRSSLGFLGAGLRQLDVNKWLFGCFSIYPPLFLLALAAGGLAIIELLFHRSLLLVLLCCLTIFVANILLTLHLSNAPRAVWQAVWAMPLFIWRQVIALLNIRQARHDFLTTQHTHTHTTIDDMNDDRINQTEKK